MVSLIARPAASSPALSILSPELSLDIDVSSRALVLLRYNDDDSAIEFWLIRSDILKFLLEIEFC